MKPSTAEYWLLKEASNLETFGQEQFTTRCPNGSTVIMGVGPHGVNLYDVDASLRQR
jgi:E3 ubiquitin-protein ligase MYLIP